MSSYLTDNATRDPKADALNFGDFRPVLKEILTTAETPLTVGIFGTWGSGKTSLMGMLRDEIDSDDEIDPDDKTEGDNDNEGEKKALARTVWFTAWKYDRQEALWRALILRVLEAMYPREDGDGPREERPILTNPDEEQQQLIALLERLEESVYQAVEWEELGDRNINWWQFLGNSGLAGIEIAAALGTGGVVPLLKQLTGGDAVPVEEIKKAAQAISRESKKYHRQQLFHMEQFEATFKEAVGLIEEARLIVFVDDLDRCLPEKGIEVLEAIKLFLEVPGVVFVLGMDREVVQRGIEARYGHFFQRQVGQREELPIRGDVYLQKIVQIPFYLPALATGDLEQFMAGLDKGLSEMTRQVFAQGLFPNPRQVKRALNIFRLLQQIARAREERPPEEGGLPPGSIAWPLLAKTVVIQTQHPGLYQLWRRYPVVVQMLEREYSRRARSEEETLLGQRRGAAHPEVSVEAGTEEREAEAQEEERRGGLLDKYLENRQQYGLLAQMLAFPTEDKAGEGRDLARFKELKLDQLAAYVRLAGTVESEREMPVDVPADLLQELLSGEPLLIETAASRLQSAEPERDGEQHERARSQLVSVLQDGAQPLAARLSAGEALAAIGDSRFRAEAWHLADEPLLGFVEIPGGEFLMGSDADQDGQAKGAELPQHTVSLPAYYMARYPVTVAQFRVFVEVSGRELRDNRALEGPENHPVRFVTWHEALAYCNWLTEALRSWKETPQALRRVLNPGQNGERPWRVILPSEAEWEKAARGEKGLIYPWGDSFEGERANYKGSGIDNTSAVGCFPGGAAPLGLLDMSGNVWEWTRSLWGTEFSEPEYKYPYQTGDGREDLQKEDKWFRVVRGGSAWNENDALRCASRSGFGPSYGHSLGFRVVVSPFFNSDL